MKSNRTHLLCALPVALMLAGCNTTLTQHKAELPGAQFSTITKSETSSSLHFPAVAPDAAEGTQLKALLDSQIAVSWSDSVDGLAKLLSQRMQVLYQPSTAAAKEQVHVQQSANYRIADVLASVNTQLGTRGQLDLVQIGTSIQLEYHVSVLDQAQGTGTTHSFAIEPAKAQLTQSEVPSDALSSAGLTPATAPTPEPLAKPSWSVSPADGTLLDALTRWAETAQWQVVWEASEDLLIPAQASYSGDFKDAVRGLFRSFSTSLNPTFYTRNNVVRVTDIGSRTGGEK